MLRDDDPDYRCNRGIGENKKDRAAVDAGKRAHENILQTKARHCKWWVKDLACRLLPGERKWQ